MKWVRFYKEYNNKADKRKNKPNGNVLALFYENKWWGENNNKPELLYEAIGAVFYHPNSDVASTSVCWNYLRENCKRISEKEARIIHPNLFKYLDQGE